MAGKIFLTVSCALVVSSLMCMGASYAKAANASAVKFSYALEKRQADGEALRIKPARKIAMNSGDSFRLFVDAKSSLYLYMILDDASGTLNAIPLEGDGSIPARSQYMVPGGVNWFKLDENSGTETFYMLFSSEPLTELEALLAKVGSGGVEGKLRQEIIDRIKSEKRSRSELSTPAEKPIAIAGTMRGSGAAGSGEKFDVLEVSAAGFYSRTIRIKHD